MPLPSRFRVLVLALAALVFAAALPSTADAQRRYRRPSRIVFVGGFGYSPYWMYDRWSQWGPYGRYPYAYDIRGLVAELRIDVEPRQAEVFVDGYYAGLVDDFDGVFQRLRVEPGGRTITIFLEGYRTEQRRLYLRPGTDQRIRLTLQPLAPGERSEPPIPSDDESGDPEAGIPPGVGPGAARGPRGEVQAPARFGTLSLRVRPVDAEIYVDGERWEDGRTGERILIQLPERRHHVEVRRDGASAYEEDVLIRRDRTLTLNVLLE